MPAIAAFAIAGLFNLIGAATWARLGYQLPPHWSSAIRIGLMVIGALAIAIGVIRGWLAYRRIGFLDAAGRVDDAVGARQQVLTLAALSRPDLSDPAHRPDPVDPAGRGALFPVLWHRASSLLESFDPKRAFGLELGYPLRRSSWLALAGALVMAIATMAMVRRLTPDQLAAHRLIDLAREIENPNSSVPHGRPEEIIAAAERVESSSLPPEQKLQQLADLTHQLKQQNQPPPDKKPASTKPAKNQPVGNKTGQSSGGSGAGKGQGKSAAGTGNGEGGKGKGSGDGPGNGSGQGQGGSQSRQGKHQSRDAGKTTDKRSAQIAELQDQIAKAEAQIQADKAKNPGPKTQPGGKQPGSGVKPDKTGSQQLAGADRNGQNSGKLNRPGSESNHGPDGAKPGGKNGNAPGGTQGDTHLGEFPAAITYEHFYKPGDGPPIQIHDARYVLFRLPEAIASTNGAGKLLLDSSGPHATTPYVNLPLKQNQPLAVAPDEQQLVPPRYRDLIR